MSGGWRGTTLRYSCCVALLFVCLVGKTCEANPVPDRVVKDFRQLVAKTAEDGVCPDESRLVGYFSAYGLGFLRPSERAAIDEHFTLFAPILVRSQAPPHHPNLGIQQFYRDRAAPWQRESMLCALREWLTADINEAPGDGVMKVVYPPKAVEEEITRARVAAAEMLTFWRERSALQAMEVMGVRENLTQDLRWRLLRAERRLDDSTAMTFLSVRPNGALDLYERASDVDSAVVRRGSLGSRETPYYNLTQNEVEKMWALLGESKVCESTNWAGFTHCVVLVLHDGVRASLSPTERGHIVYEDNAGHSGSGRLTLESESLWRWIWEIFHDQIGMTVP